MEINTKQLRIEPGRIISLAAGGQEITVTYRGKPRAKIVPLFNRKVLSLEEPEAPAYEARSGAKRKSAKPQAHSSPPDYLFGLWKNREDTINVEQFVRNLRKGRKSAN